MIRLALSGLRHYWKLSLFLAGGVAMASAILTGSLLVGDSVKGTLAANAGKRVGEVQAALVGGERFFTQELAESVAGVPVLVVPGTVSTPDGRKRANDVRIYGVDRRFWALAGFADGEAPTGEFFAVGGDLKERLGLSVGERVNARMELPGRVSRDAPLSGETEKTATLGGAISHVVSGDRLGRFSLLAQQTPALNVFVPLEALQAKLQKPGRSNLILSDEGEGFAGRVEASWGLADLELRVRGLKSGGRELVSDRVFIGEEAEAAISAVRPDARGVLSYLVNEFSADGRSVPYSVGTGIANGVEVDLGFEKNFGFSVMPADAIIVNRWLAGPEDEGGLDLKVGDRVSLSFFAVGDSREFVVRGDDGEFTFTVSGVVDEAAPAMRDGWVPDFPGLETAARLADWESGIPLDTQKIRPADEDYWERFRATPKAFVPLAAAQAMWGNRFGKVSAMRLAAGEFDEATFTESLRAEISLVDVGMALQFPRADAEASVAGALDFGALFGSLSGFLIASALLLVALLCVFGMESRASQIGLLGALGFVRRDVRRLFAWEAGLMAAVGALLGVFGGILYTKLALWALGGVWRGASTGVEFQFYAEPSSLVGGVLGTFAVAIITLRLAGRRITSRPPRELLAGQTAGDFGSAKREKRRAVWVLILGVCGGVAAVLAASGLDGEKQAGAFFGAGFALLLAGLAAFSMLLKRRGRGAGNPSLWELGRRNASRRAGRSVAVAAMVASGVFLVVAVNAFRLVEGGEPSRRDTGTGGFDFVGSTTLPVYEDLNDAKVRDRFGLEEYSGEDLSFVRFRVRSGGEEASCLNLNHAARPRVIGVDPALLGDRGAFRFASILKGLAFETSPWELLEAEVEGDDVVPVIGDKASVMWALKKKLGDFISYPDGRGGEVRMRIVGLLENSVLQGNLVMAESAFTRAFPDAGGYEFFLIDTAGGSGTEVIEAVTKGLGQRGASFESAAARLAAYAQVQNTYISIFSVLGGLGVLLGTAGVGLLIARNVLERRGEMGLMTALGFRRNALVRMVLGEHLLLVVAGVVCGVIAAMVAVSPNLVGRAASFPLGLVFIMVVAIAAAGLAFCFLAARLALRGSLLDAIRSE